MVYVNKFVNSVDKDSFGKYESAIISLSEIESANFNDDSVRAI